MSENYGRSVEQWRYAGVRVNRAGKLVDYWYPQPPADKAAKVFAHKASYAVGGWYKVDVTRTPEGVTMHGDPTYDHRGEPHPRWEAESEAAEAEIAVKRAEASAKRMSALDEAMGPLLEAAGKCRTWQQQEALQAAVARRLNKAFRGAL